MSHHHERAEKVCLNCGAQLTGRYCPDCGQENLEPKESVWHLFVHFFNDVTHFDGKFFSSMKYLLLKPGFLSEEYMKGRRASYLNPIRMYLFISAFFFLMLLSFFVGHGGEHTNTVTHKKKERSIVGKGFSEVAKVIDSLDTEPDTTYYPKSTNEYDSMQALLPIAERDAGIDKYMNRKMASLNEKTRKDKSTFKEFAPKFFHSMPYMLFVSLPLVTLMFKIFYIRRKQYYYVSHGIFVIHFYCLVFITLLLAYTFKTFGYWGSIIGNLLYLGMFIYLYAAMLRFYKQSKGKTLIKFAGILFGGLVLALLLFLILVIISLFSIA